MRNDRVSEGELAAMAHAGDAEAFGELVTRYAAQARRLARTILLDPDDADDAAQDGFLAAWRHRGRYDPVRRGIGHDPQQTGGAGGGCA